jgi:hypothetical protein
MREKMTVGVALALLAWFAWVPNAGAESKVLDGKTFEGVLGEKGQTKSEAETVIFQAGKLHSNLCDPLGFGSGPYSTKASGGSVAVEADTTSPKEGTMHWSGTIKAGHFEGTVLWTKADKTTVNYWFKTTEKK